MSNHANTANILTSLRNIALICGALLVAPTLFAEDLGTGAALAGDFGRAVTKNAQQRPSSLTGNIRFRVSIFSSQPATAAKAKKAGNKTKSTSSKVRAKRLPQKKPFIDPIVAYEEAKRQALATGDAEALAEANKLLQSLFPQPLDEAAIASFDRLLDIEVTGTVPRQELTLNTE